MTHAEFAKKDAVFIAACERAGIKPTRRQAMKFRRGLGAAYAKRKG